MALISLFLTTQTKAQHRFKTSLFPGYHVLNSDKITHYDSNSDVSPKTNFVIGGKLTWQTEFGGHLMDISMGYLHGKSIVFEGSSSLESDAGRKAIALKYNTLPFEVMRVFGLHEKTELSLGINVAVQHRIVEYETYNIPKDRLLSFGAGLSGNIQTQLKTFRHDNGYIFGSLAFRWTEYMVHDAKGRDLDDFTLRHVTLSPQIGIAFNID
jgi:hypothetical protein